MRVARAGQVEAGARRLTQVNQFLVAARVAVRDLTRAQDLIDRVEKSVGVCEADVVELGALLRVQVVPLQRFEVEADGGNRRLQLVGDGVDEGVVLFVAADFADEEDGVEDEARDDDAEEADPQHQERHLAPVEQNPTDVQSHGQPDQARPQRDEERDGFAVASQSHAAHRACYSKPPS